MDCLNDLKLSATPLSARMERAYDADAIVVRVTSNPNEDVRWNRALLVDSAGSSLPSGYGAYLSRKSCRPQPPVYSLPPALSYLDDGDIVQINPREARIWVMYRRDSFSNSLLLTERCNSWCIMCSQPPKATDNESLARAWFDAIPLMSTETRELGFTGGEPTLLGDQFIELVVACRDHLPSTGIHVLSNGRLFNYLSFAQELAAAKHADLVIGIPIYSDLAWQHDFIVQADHAFDQTIRGILNLARCGLRVELRVVVHRHSSKRLPRLAEFIARNLPFVEHIAIMGLEPIGFAKSNLDALWIDPIEYQAELSAAVRMLVNHSLNVSIYNHQLCVLPRELWPFSRKSISDWKNIYLPLCHDCAVRDQCGGFFHSATTAHSQSIQPVSNLGLISTT